MSCKSNGTLKMILETINKLQHLLHQDFINHVEYVQYYGTL